MVLESFIFHFPGRSCFRRVGDRISWHRVNGHSDVGYQSGVVVGVFLQRKLFKSWSILVNLVSSRFLKSGSQVSQDCVLVTLIIHLRENSVSGIQIKLQSTIATIASKNFEILIKEQADIWRFSLKLYLILNCTCNKLQLTTNAFNKSIQVHTIYT